ncbi:MAG: right-handed parallel beta-helix repeat-containing protein, partial [archaeon]
GMGLDPTQNINGTIDEVKIYNISLTAEQVLALYQNRTDLIVSQETNVGEVWNATITPNDGTEDGATVWSNSLTVLAAPTTYCGGAYTGSGKFNVTSNVICQNEVVTINGNITIGSGTAPDSYFNNGEFDLSNNQGGIIDGTPNTLDDETGYTDNWNEYASEVFKIIMNESTHQLQLWMNSTSNAWLYAIDIDNNLSTGDSGGFPGTDVLFVINDGGFGVGGLCYNKTLDDYVPITDGTTCNHDYNEDLNENATIYFNTSADNKIIEAVLNITGAWIDHRIRSINLSDFGSAYTDFKNASGSYAPGNLTLINTTFNINTTSNGSNRITVNNVGSMYVTNNSVVQALDSNNGYYTWIVSSSNFFIDNSTIRHVGYNDGGGGLPSSNSGLYLAADCNGDVIRNSNLLNNRISAYVVGNNCNITNSYIGADYWGILTFTGTGSYFLNNTIVDPVILFSAGHTIDNNLFNGAAISIFLGTDTITNNRFTNLPFASVPAISTSTNQGVNFNDSIVINNTFESSVTIGMYLKAADNWTIQGNNFSSTWGLYLLNHSTIHNISNNNFFSSDYSLINNQSDTITAENNWWDTTACADIDTLIYDDDENGAAGAVDYDPVLNALYPGGTSTSCTTPDSTAPAWQDNLTNYTSTTKFNDSVWFSINWSDDTGVDASIFSWNGSSCGAMENISTLDCESNASCIHNITRTINCTRGENICWKFYANDTAGNDNVTQEWCFVVNNTAPTHSTPILNATSVNNYTTDNLTVYNISTTDADGDSVKNIFNWYMNGTSLTVLNMPFEGGSTEGTTTPTNGTTKDYSPYQNNATIVANSTNSGPQWNSTGGYDGRGAYEFDGSDDYINLHNLNTKGTFDAEQDWSVTGWFKTPNSNQIQGAVFSNNYGDYELIRVMVNYGNLSIWVRDSNNQGPPSGLNVNINNNTWYFFAITHNFGGDIVFYINNTNVTQEDTFSGDFHAEALGEDYYLGRVRYNAGYTIFKYFNGTIDEVMIFNRSLSPEQVLALYQNRTDLIVSQETNKGGVWNATIIPNDGYEDGATVWSNSLTILNSPPAASNVVLNSTSGTNYTTENLTLYWDASDADNDAIKNINNWYMNGTPLTVLNMPFEGGSLDGTIVGTPNGAKDYSPYSNNGTVYKAPWNSTGGYDGKGAYEFDGDDYIKNNLGIITSYPFTFSAWVKTNSSTGQTIISIVDKDVDNILYWVGIGSTGSARISANNGTASSTIGWGTTYDDNEWHHIVGVFKNNTLKEMYADGSSLGTLTTDISYNSNVDSFSIGVKGDSSPSEYFNGTIDDVMIWNRSLSPEHILALYQNRTDLIVSNETNVGEVWNATVTLNDGTEDGTTVWSNSLTILETPSACTDSDGDGFNASGIDCGIIDCNDNNASILPPYNGMSIVNDTIVCNGTYYVNATVRVIQINSENLTLECNDTVIIGDGSGNGLDVDSKNNITIKGCTFYNYFNGMVLTNTINSNITNNSLYNMSYRGMDVNTVVNSTISYNTIKNISDVGIQLEITSTGNNIFGNDITNVSDGIVISDSSTRCNLYNNTITNTTGHGIAANSYYTNVTGNIIFNNGESGVNVVDDVANITINGNVIQSSNYGINVEPRSGNVTVFNNIISDCEEGITLSEAGEGIAVYNNTMNLRNGISIFNTGLTIHIYDNTINNTEVYAITLSNTSNSNITGNVIENCTVIGIDLGSSSNNNSISYNTINTTSENAIRIVNSNETIIANNVLHDGRIFLSSGERAFVRNNSITVDGIRINSNNNTIIENLLYGQSGGSGFIGILGDWNNVSDNTIFSGSPYSISLSGAYNNTVQENNLEEYMSIINSNDNNIIGNNISLTGIGITLNNASYNLLRENIVSNGSITLTGGTTSSEENILINNTINTTNSEDPKIVFSNTVSATNNIIYQESDGKINWTITLDSTKTENSSLSLGINPIITNNFISFTPSHNDSLLNRTATLTFYSVAGVTTPVAYRNGVACDSSICSNVTDLGGNNYQFNVTQFSNYSVSGACVDNDGDGFNATVIGCCTTNLNCDCNDNNASIIPPTAALTITADIMFCPGTYSLNTTEDLMAIANHNTVVECNSTIMVGNNSGTGTGIVANNRENITIRGCTWNNYGAGISVSGLNHLVYDNTVINASSNQAIRLTNLNHSNISGNFIINGTARGINLEGQNHNITISNNVIQHLASSGILLQTGTSNISIFNNNITNATAVGIRLNYAGEGNLIYDNILVSSGIWASNTAYTVQIYDNRINHTQGNLQLTNTNNSIVTRNTLFNVSSGISVDDSQNNTVSNNIIWSASVGGISLNSCLDIFLYNNTVSYSSTAITVQTTNNSNITGNNIHDNPATGIELRSSSNNNIISSNIIYNISGYAVYLHQGSANNSILNNNMNNISTDVIKFYTAGSGNLIQGNIFNQDTTAISLNFVNDTKIISNTMNHTILPIYSNTGSNITISNNIIYNATNPDSIFLTGEDYLVYNNTITRSSGNQIMLLIVNNSNITGNKIYNCSARAIRLMYGANINNTISYNIIENIIPGVGGIALNGQVVNNLIFNNNITNSTSGGISLTNVIERNIIYDNVLNNSPLDLYNSSNNLIYSNIIIDSSINLNPTATDPSMNNTFINNTINTTNPNDFKFRIGNAASATNNIVYQNSDGKINWTITLSSEKTEISTLELNVNPTISNNFLSFTPSGSSSLLNTNATITFYNIINLNANPVIYRNGSLCSSSICSNVEDLGGNDYRFNVTSFSNYTIMNGTTCTDSDGDGFNSTGGSCGVADCNDNNASIFPPSVGMSIVNDTILCNGTYYLNATGDGLITVSGENLTLKCNQTTMIGNTSGNGLYIPNRNNVTIKDCTWNNYNDAIVFSGTNNIITNNTIYHTSSYGISQDGGTGNTISDNTIINTTNEGIYLELTSTGTNIFGNNLTNSSLSVTDSSTGCNVYDNTLSDITGDAMIIDSNNNVTSNTIIKVGGTAIDMLDGRTNITIENNIIQHVSSGINMEGTCTNITIANNIINNGTKGIDLTGVDILVYNNNITNITESGIEIESSNYTNVTGNTITATATGIYVHTNSISSIIHDNKLENLSGNAIFLQNTGSSNKLFGNTINTTGNDAITIDNSSDTNVTDNTIFDGRIYLVTSERILVKNNSLTNDGIIVDSNNNTIIENTLSGTLSTGYIGINSDWNNITNNTVDNKAATYSIYLNSGHNNTIQDNTLLSYMFALNSHNNNIIENNITVPGSNSLIIRGSDYNLIKNNIIYGGPVWIHDSGATPDENILFNNTINTSDPATNKIQITARGSLFTNYVAYENQNGAINWTVTLSLTNTEQAELGIGINPIITNNFLSFTPNPSNGILNRTATLTFYNVAGISTPTAYRDGTICDVSICSAVTDLGGNNYQFNVTQFSNYSVGNASTTYNITVWIDNVETDQFNRTAVPHRVLVNITQNGLPSGNITVGIAEQNGRNFVFPLVETGNNFEALVTNLTNSSGLVEFIIAPTRYNNESPYNISVNIYSGGGVTQSKNLSLSSDALSLGTEVVGKTLPGINILKNNMESWLSLTLFMKSWVNDGKGVYQSINVSQVGGSSTTLSPIQVGAINVINITLLNSSNQSVSGTLTPLEDYGWLLHASTSPSANNHSTQLTNFNITNLLYTMGTLYNVDANYSIAVYNETGELVTTLYFEQNDTLREPTDSDYSIATTVKNTLNNQFESFLSVALNIRESLLESS